MYVCDGYEEANASSVGFNTSSSHVEHVVVSLLLVLYQNLFLTSYYAPFPILLLCFDVPCNSQLLRVTSSLTAGHKSMLITIVRNRLLYYSLMLCSEVFFYNKSSVQFLP